MRRLDGYRARPPGARSVRGRNEGENVGDRGNAVEMIAERRAEVPDARCSVLGVGSLFGRAMLVLALMLVPVLVLARMLVLVLVLARILVLVLVGVVRKLDDRLGEMDVVGLVKCLMQRRREDRTAGVDEGRHHSGERGAQRHVASRRAGVSGRHGI